MINNKKRLSFGYEDTDKSIEIELYGIVFKIENINEIENVEKIDRDNEEAIETVLEKILGEGAIERINVKRRKDGYKELDLIIELNILGCIFEAYGKAMANGVLGRLSKTVDDINEDTNRITNGNRESRRNHFNDYRRNRGNYRRY